MSDKGQIILHFTVHEFPSTGNPQLTSSVNVIIHVLDVNEFAPEVTIPYETSVCENAKPRQVK